MNVLPQVDFLALWSESDLSQLQDPELIREALEYKEELEEGWIEVRSLLEKYPQHFPIKRITKDLFIFAYGNVVMRCFGWSLPCTMLIPMADALNHKPIDTSNEMIDLKLHKVVIDDTKLNDNKLKAYATKSKMALNYTDLIEGKDEERVAIKPLVIDDDIVSIAKDTNTIHLNMVDYNIWNM